MRQPSRGKSHLIVLVLLALFVALSASLVARHGEARGPDGYVWTEYAGNPVFSGTSRAYYPRVIEVNGTYCMWYTDLVGGLYRCGYTDSADGLTWASPTILSVGTGQPSHVVVVNVGDETSPYYRMWYGDAGTWPYSDSCFRTAESSDGLTWTNDQAIGQDAGARLVQVPGSQWVYGSYGPGAVLYNASGYDSLNMTDPMGNKYVMYYDQYTYPGSPTTEVTMLALSVDGINWSRWDNNPLPPVINASGGSTAWDAQYVYVWSVIKDGGTYHAWYSGGKTSSQEGIGYAISSDGLNWTKDSQSLMHIGDAGVPAWRDSRTYTPCVLKEGAVYKMWYTGVGGGLYKVGLANALPGPTVTSVAPNQGMQGQSQSVTVTGTYLTGATSVSFGSGITVGSFSVDNSTQITASIAIGGSAATGLRDVSVSNSAGTGTKAGGFTVVALGPPAAPGLVSPANGATVAGTSVTFEWTPVTGATDYKLIVNKTNSLYYSGRKTELMVGNVATYVDSGYPANGTVYYWWVIAYNAGGGHSDYAQVIANGFSFTNASALGTPTLVTPANGATVTGASVSYEWTLVTGAVNYKLIVNTTNNVFATGRKSERMVGNVTTYVDSGYPANGTVYYWWVIAYNAGGGHSDYTQVIANGFSFTNASALGTPTLVTPANGATVTGASVSYEWTLVTGATDYKLIVNTTNNLYYSGRKTSLMVGNVTTYVDSGYPANGTVYYWWVVAYDSTGGHSDYTQVIASGCSLTNAA